MIDLAFRAGTPESDKLLAWDLMKNQDPAIVRANRKLWQEALVHMVEARRSADPLARLSLQKALQAHPGRLVRSLVFQ
jgi:hypothetical protein